MSTDAFTSTELEVIDKGVCTPAHPALLLSVHGAWHGAWCWDEYLVSCCDMMLEPGWAALAERIHSWLGAQRL